MKLFTRRIFLSFSFALAFCCAQGQDDAEYIKANAVRIANPDTLSDSVYNLLAPFQVILFGEVHGTNESPQFVTALANLFTSKGDSVSLGLEIPPDKMTNFILNRSDSSIYASDFFLRPVFESGKESVPWAQMISQLNKNPKIEFFFFDTTIYINARDRSMSAAIKSQIKKHPNWKTITLSGNYHNKTSDENSMTGFLLHDKELNVSSKICSLNLQYFQGACVANFGHGLEKKMVGGRKTIYDTALKFDRYLLLVSAKSDYEWNGFYYTKFITPAKMTKHE